jgi:CheY-like chemotaxis protein
MDPVVLIVDDNDDNRFTLPMRLASCGYANIVTAENGREALEKMRSGPVDLVLLDITMPEMNGYEVLEHLKANKELRDFPVIVISALGEMDSVIKCIELGAEDYLAKAFNPTLLRARVGASLEKKRLRDEVRAGRDRLQHELDADRALQFGMPPRAFPAWSADRAVGIAMAAAERPDVILMDLNLPEVSGWEAARRQKTDPATRGIPIIALSAHAMAGDREKALATGCDDFDTKPVEFDRLRATIEQVLAGKDGLA